MFITSPCSLLLLTLFVVSHNEQFFVLDKWISHCHERRIPLFFELWYIILVSVICIIEVQLVTIFLFTLLDFVALPFIHNCYCGALAEDLVSFGLDFGFWCFRRILVDLGNFIFRHVWCRLRSRLGRNWRSWTNTVLVGLGIPAFASAGAQASTHR